jgi:hypothetical protein
MNSKQLTQRQKVALAVHLLDGARRAVDIEDIAMKVAQLFPGNFRWLKYADQIDLEKVRLCAKNLAAGARPFLTGGVKDGWMLTPAGVAWCSTVPTVEQRKNDARADDQASIMRSGAYRKFQKSAAAGITLHEVREILRVDEYTSKRRRRERIQALANSAGGNESLTDFLRFLESAFPGEWV